VKDTIPVYVINLDRSADRMRRIASELKEAGLPFNRVQAVDAASLPPQVPEYDRISNARRYLAPLTPGEIACVLSHRKVWRLMADEPEQTAAVVLEDDARFAANIHELGKVLETIAQSPHPEMTKLYDLVAPRHKIVRYRKKTPLLPALSTTAQALNRTAALSLLRFTERFYEPADVIIQRWWDHGVTITSVSPSMFSEVDHNEASTIRSHGQKPHEGRLLRELRRPVWQMKRLAAATAAVLANKRRTL